MPARFVAQRLDWRDCGGGLECTTVRAPLDWDRPDDRREIELAITRRPATGERIGALFMNPGGPGASGFDAVHDRWASYFSPALAERFDLVGWDPRGVGRSAPVTCYTDPVDQVHWLYDPPTPHWRDDPDAWAAADRARAADYVEACVRGTGDVLGHIDTLSTVQDLDLLRTVLGDTRLHYLGFSYGTRIGQYYLDRYPDRVGRMVLDGVVDPLVGPLEYTETQEAGFEAALRRFAEECAPRFGPACPIPEGSAAGLAAVRDLFLRFDGHPQPATAADEHRVLTGMIVRDAIVESLYRDDDWAELRALLRELGATPPVTDRAFALADAYYDFDPGVGARTNFGDALLAIDCLDRGVERDPVRLAEHVRRLREAAPTLALGTPPVPEAVCAAWPYPPRLVPPRAIRGEDAPPVLVVSTTGDPATPHSWGLAVAERLVSARLVTYHGEGHTAYVADDTRPSCVRDTVDAYLIDGAVPAADPHCGR